MKRIKREDLVVGQKYLVELEFNNDDGEGYLPLYFENTGNSYNSFYLGKNTKIYSLDKVIIPKFVAQWISEHRQLFSNLLTAYNALSQKRNRVSEWVNKNIDTFARAWLDGYEIVEPKEPLYWVRNKKGESLLFRFSKNINTSSGNSIDHQKRNKREYTFTEKEIKEYDERYWAFAVPVEEEDD